jgi:hypothetical protein
MKFAIFAALIAITLPAPALAIVDQEALYGGGGHVSWIMSYGLAGLTVWVILFYIGALILNIFQYSGDEIRKRKIFASFIGFLLLVVIFMIVKYV